MKLRVRVDRLVSLPRVQTLRDGEGVTLFDARRGLYWRGNPVAAVVWDGIIAELSFDALVALVQEEFDVTLDVAQGDVEMLLQGLCKAGLVVKAP